MTAKKLISISLAALIACMGQARSWLDYDQVLEPATWLRTTNAASLTTFLPADSTQHLMADAAITGSTTSGHFAPQGTAPKLWQTDANVRAIYRMSSRVVLRGSMEYSHWWCKDVTGSIWIEPQSRPFDITETADSTQGNTRLERYGLNGEAAVNVSENVSLGAQFSYATASYAKQKDPRHTNSLMTLTTTAGATWHRAGWRLGASYILNRTTEALTFRNYGRTDRVYHYLVDFGATYGRIEQAEGVGYTGNDYERPWLDMEHGIAVQGGYDHPGWSMVAQWKWLHCHGHYGMESPAHIDFNKHNANLWNATAWLKHSCNNNLYLITIDWQHENMRNNERTYRAVTGGGITDVVYYDDRLTGRRQTIDYTVAADARLNINRHLAAWALSLVVNHHRTSTDAILFPFVRKQKTHLTTIHATASRSFITGGDKTWTIRGSLSWGKGGGTPKTDTTLATAADDALPPATYDLILMRQYEWNTAQRTGIGLAIRHSLPVAAQKARIYADLAGRLQFAGGTHYLADAHRHTVAITLGCTF